MSFNRMSVLTLWIALIVSLGVSASDSVSATTIQGTATFIDGDTIEIDGER
jgi:hypothetical protein